MLTAKLSAYAKNDVVKMEEFLCKSISVFMFENDCTKSKHCNTCPHRMMCTDLITLHAFFNDEIDNGYPHIKTKH